MGNFQTLKNQAAVIRDEQQDYKNTALRIGKMFIDMLEQLEDVLPNENVQPDTLTVETTETSYKLKFSTIASDGSIKSREVSLPLATETKAGIMSPALLKGVKDQLTELEKNTFLNDPNGNDGYPDWKPNVKYNDGDAVINPNGELVSSVGGSQMDEYDPGEWEKTSVDRESRKRDAVIRSSIGNTEYVVCETSGNIQQKAVTIRGFNLNNKARFLVKMNDLNLATDAILRVDSDSTSYSKPLFYNGKRARADNSWPDGAVLDIYYDGTNFQATDFKAGSGSGDNMILDWNTDVAATRKQVKTKDRKELLQISYKNGDGDVINEQYVGTLYTDEEWVKDDNWIKDPSAKQFADLEGEINGKREFVLVKSVENPSNINELPYYTHGSRIKVVATAKEPLTDSQLRVYYINLEGEKTNQTIKDAKAEKEIVLECNECNLTFETTTVAYFSSIKIYEEQNIKGIKENFSEIEEEFYGNKVWKEIYRTTAPNQYNMPNQTLDKGIYKITLHVKESAKDVAVVWNIFEVVESEKIVLYTITDKIGDSLVSTKIIELEDTKTISATVSSTYFDYYQIEKQYPSEGSILSNVSALQNDIQKIFSQSVNCVKGQIPSYMLKYDVSEWFRFSDIKDYPEIKISQGFDIYADRYMAIGSGNITESDGGNIFIIDLENMQYLGTLSNTGVNHTNTINWGNKVSDSDKYPTIWVSSAEDGKAKIIKPSDDLTSYETLHVITYQGELFDAIQILPNADEKHFALFSYDKGKSSSDPIARVAVVANTVLSSQSVVITDDNIVVTFTFKHRGNMQGGKMIAGQLAVPCGAYDKGSFARAACILFVDMYLGSVVSTIEFNNMTASIGSVLEPQAVALYKNKLVTSNTASTARGIAYSQISFSLNLS